MNEAPAFILALVGGALLGSIFFGGLWWTIRRGLSSRRPAILFLGSLLLRTSIAIAGFYFIARGDWRRLMACLFGFLVARMFAMRLIRAPSEKGSPIVEGGET
jgi:F1F0 ATPase subunit 2